MWFVTEKSTTVFLWLFALLQLGCGQDVAISSRTNGDSKSTPGQSPKTTSPTSTGSSVCGIEITTKSPLILVLDGVQPKKGELPWHATVYGERKNSKERLCGATIIRPNFLITAAHCVYDEITSTVQDAKNLFVATGNIHLQYDSPLHNTEVVKKSAVEKIYVPPNYYGLRGNYGSDIALLELKEPFEFSSTLSPACLDFHDSILEAGAVGKIFKSVETAAGEPSGTLETTTVPYLTNSQCQQIIDNTDFLFLSNDKFCTGHTNETGLCAGDGGNGLVFKKSDRWYLMGIASVSLGIDHNDGASICHKHSTTLYTKVPIYGDWIMSVISQ